jgi:uncharacterized membrane protein YphA (DoxX/SURF4 family)
MTEATVSLPRGKIAAIALWLLGALPALGVGLSGVAKFLPAAPWRAYFVDWGFPAWFALVIGAAEAGGAVLTWIPRYALYGASLLGSIMAGAAVTLQLHRGSPPGRSTRAPIMYLVVFTIVAALRWRERARSAHSDS